jgi:hypothetical protein
MTLDLIKDGYDRKARLYPALLVVLPIAVAVGAVVSIRESVVESAAAALASCGGAFLLTQLARDRGKRGESALFNQWGGMPSITILRHSNQRIDALTKARYHKRLSALVKGTKSPSVAMEEENPRLSDDTYSTWCSYLRSHTRDTKKYALLFQENVNYGYRRNVWGLRPFGLTTSALSLVICSGWAYLVYKASGHVQGELVGSAVIDLLLLTFWGVVVSPQWIQIPANAYAERLVETVEHLSAK